MLCERKLPIKKTRSSRSISSAMALAKASLIESSFLKDLETVWKLNELVFFKERKRTLENREVRILDEGFFEF